MGNPVRYDGGHKLDHFLRDTLGQYVDYVPVCPEVECGMSVPREAMRLEGKPESLRLMTRSTRVDKTDDGNRAKEGVVQPEAEISLRSHF